MNIGMAPARNRTAPTPMAKYQNHWRWRVSSTPMSTIVRRMPLRAWRMTVAEQGDFAELEQRRAECFQGGVELFRVLQVADRVDVDDEVADEGDAGEALDPEGDVADVAPGVFACRESDGVGAGGAHTVDGNYFAGLELTGPLSNGGPLRISMRSFPIGK